MGQVAVPAAFWRGGTSRAIIFTETDLLPFTPTQRDRIALAALGSPDAGGRQIDGVGGGISSMSKVCVLAWTGREVRFTFGQVEVHEPRIDWTGTCGNMSAAVGPFAVDAGWVATSSPATCVPVIATSSGKRFIAEVPTPGGQLESEGAYRIDGVPAPGARICLRYLEPAGTLGSGVFPTRQACQPVAGAEASIVDVANPMVFVPADAVGLSGYETPAEIEASQSVMAHLEEIRASTADLIGLSGVLAVPKIALLAPPRSEDVDIVARAVSMGRIHRTFPATGAMALAAAVVLPGTTAHALARPSDTIDRTVRIGHPAGAIEIGIDVQRVDGQWLVRSATTYRTARKIMDGCVYVPASYLTESAWFDA